jgi:hypothetical protein
MDNITIVEVVAYDNLIVEIPGEVIVEEGIFDETFDETFE